MDSIRPSRPELEELVPYDAKEVKAEVILASNENPVNLPAELVARLSKRLPEFAFNRYPDPTARELRALIAEANGLDVENVLLGNGGDELIFDLLLAWGGPGRTILDMPPTFSMYGIDAQVTGTAIVRIPRLEDFSVDRDAVLARLAQGGIDIVVIANPNNPTGGLTDESFLIDVLKATDAVVLVDEAYFEFSRHTMRPHMTRHKNLLILRTFSKAFSMAGLRIGYVLGARRRHPRADEGAAALLGRLVLSVGRERGLQGAHGLRAGDSRHHAGPRPDHPRALDARRNHGLSHRGELRALPGGACGGALARSAAQPLGADAGLLTRGGT